MRKLWLTGALVMLATVAFATLADAQTTSNGPYYATPSWDQKLQCDTQATCPRFIVLSNWNSQAVLDRETGLVWERSPDPGSPPGTRNKTWIAAVDHCNTLTTGNRLGWRLPTSQELASLVDPSVGSVPLLPAGHPFTNVAPGPGNYWTATIDASSASFALAMHFEVIGFSKDNKGSAGFAWCVRGGQGVDAQ